MEPIRVMILEDDDGAFLIEKHTIANQTDIELVGREKTKEAFLHLANELRPDVALMDINLTNQDDQYGIDTAIELSLTMPKTKIIMLSGILNEDTVRSTMGIEVATNYLVKNNPERIPQAIRDAHNGTRQVDASVLDFILKDYRDTLKNSFKDSLTTREIMFLEMFYRGYTVDQIAALNHIEPQSVRNVQQKISKKCLGWKWRFRRLSTLELAERAKKLGLF